MFRVYKYRLYPTKKQTMSIIAQFNSHCYLYNYALSQRKNVYKQTGQGIGYFKQSSQLLPKLKNENKGIAFCNYSSLQQTLRRLDKSFKAFFTRVCAGEKAGYPRFKTIDRFNAINYATIGDGCKIKDNRLYLQNIGSIKVNWHRPIIGKIKTLSINKKNKKYYVSFIVETESVLLPINTQNIGIDVGINAFITTSDGSKIETPKYFRKAEKRLVKAQRRLSRRKKGSSRRGKARILVAKCHEGIANQRLDFCHKTAYRLVNSYGGFAVEALSIKNMVKNRYFAKSISDAGWGMFLAILKSKAESAGRLYQEVPPNGTSQGCSSCSEIVKKSLSVRMHNCPHCGLSLDRDINAARTILQKAWIEPSWRGGVVMPLVEARS